MFILKLEDLITKIPSIGDKRSLTFNRLGIFTIKDLIEYYPRDYEDRSKIKKVNELNSQMENVFVGIVKNKPDNMKIGKLNITRLKIGDETGTLEIVWFNQPYLKNNFLIGGKYIFFGKVMDKYNKLEMLSPEYELVGDKEILTAGRIVPIYKLTSGISQKILRKIINKVISETNFQFENIIPEKIIKKYNLLDKNSAVKNIHFPESDEQFFKARKTLVFEELFLLQYALLKLKGNIKKRPLGMEFSKVTFSEITSNLPYELTNAQKKVLDELTRDFYSGFQMNRLIQGDVGSGKTLVALLAAYIAIKNDYQACIMAPTEVLAAQHYEYFKSIFDDLGIKTVLLTGSLKKREKRFLLEDIQLGIANMVIGTHALIQEGVNFFNLGFVVTDEQHRFGVKQREVLTNKGSNPHTLVMTATPIPRTLALILYGDLDISTIDELPPGRQKIDTFLVNSSYRERLLAFIKKEVAQGHQCYIICPMIEENETSDLKAVLSYAEELKETLDNITIECIHGKMAQIVKNDIMDRFSKNEINVIVSTTVIEVGINVPNATLMIIENAERFGLSALHQLRGRVGRGAEKSYCILISNNKNPKTLERLNAMTKSGDGFYISELDLKLRGPGDFFGTRQHGIPELKIANLYKDMEVLKEVQDSIEALQLSENEKIIINKKIENYFFDENKGISL